jgi:hypothetical protein
LNFNCSIRHVYLFFFFGDRYVVSRLLNSFCDCKVMLFKTSGARPCLIYGLERDQAREAESIKEYWRSIAISSVGVCQQSYEHPLR